MSGYRNHGATRGGRRGSPQWPTRGAWPARSATLAGTAPDRYHPELVQALVVLANYGRDTNESVVMPWGAGCQTIGLLAYREARSPHPRAVVGLTDLSARKYVAKQLGHDVMTFAVPFDLFREMEGNVPGSFLERETWNELLADHK